MIIYSKLKEKSIHQKHKNQPLNSICTLLKKFLMIKLIEEMKIKNYQMLENQNALKKLLIMVNPEKKRINIYNYFLLFFFRLE